MTTNSSSRNERWSAIETTSSSRARSSDRLRSLLFHQDDILSQKITGLRIDTSSSHTMPTAAIRKASYDSLQSLGSMSSISSMGSMGSTGNRICGMPRKNSSSKFRYRGKKDSMNSLLSKNSRWKSTPPKKRSSVGSVNIKLLQSSLVLSPGAAGGHDSGRWMATVASDHAMDRPIGAISRKASLSTILPSSRK